MYQTIEKGTDGEPVYTNYGNPNDELEISNKGLANQYIHANFEAKVNYHRTWDKHDFTASAMFRQESMTLTGVAYWERTISIVHILPYPQPGYSRTRIS